MAESNGQDTENTEQNKAQTTQIIQQKTETNPNQTVKTRKNLFNTLDVVLKTSKEKFNKQKASNTDRQRWARIIICLCSIR
jgi:hypothetical protein